MLSKDTVARIDELIDDMEIIMQNCEINALGYESIQRCVDLLYEIRNEL